MISFEIVLLIILVIILLYPFPTYALYLEALTVPLQAVFILQVGANVKVTELMGLAVIIGWLFRMIRRGSIRMNKYICYPAIIFLFITFLSLTGTLTHWDILRNVSIASVSGSTTGRQAPLTRGIVTAAWAAFSIINMIATADIIRDKKTLLRVIYILMISSTVAALYGFYKLLFLNLPLPEIWFPGDITTGWGRGWVIMRSDGTFLEPSTMANYFIFMIPLALANWIILRERRTLAMFAAQVIALISTFSPGGWVTFVGSLFIYLPMTMKVLGKSIWSAMRIMILLMLVVVIVLTAMVMAMGVDGQMIALGFLEKLLGVDVNLSYDLSQANLSSRISRLGLSYIALEMWQRNPIIGVGIGNYPFLHQYYADLGNLEYREDVTNTPSVLYLLLLSETGLLGLAAFCFFGYRLIVYLYKYAVAIKDKELKWVLIAVASSLVGAAVNGLVLDNPFPSYYWLVAGVGLSAISLAKRQIVLSQLPESEDV